MPRRPNLDRGDPVPAAPRDLPAVQRRDWEHLRELVGRGGFYRAAWLEDLRILVGRRARLRAMNGKTPEVDRRGLEREVRAQLVAFGLARGRGAAPVAEEPDRRPGLYRLRDGRLVFATSKPAGGAELVGTSGEVRG